MHRQFNYRRSIFTGIACLSLVLVLYFDVYFDRFAVLASDETSGQATINTDTGAGQGTSSTTDGQAPTAESSANLDTQPVQTPSVRPNNVSKPAVQASKPLKLFGRIEELCAQTGAKIPIKLQTMKGKMDTPSPSRLSSQVSQYNAQARVASFPTEWGGVWTGNLQIYTKQFDPICWQFDPDEANQEASILQPGVTGQTTFNFTRDNSGKIYLEPTKFIFGGYKDVSREMAQYRDSFNKMLGSQSGQSPFGALFGNNAMMPASSKVPVTYVMWFGDLEPSYGVTGNALRSKVVKNEIRQLSSSVLEQNIVTSEVDRNAKTGKIRNSYAESVLRFQVQSSNQLYVQAAKVNYNFDGKFMNKVVLYGTVYRSSAASSYPSYPNTNPFGSSNPYGNMGNPNSLMNSFDQIFKQLQGH